MSVGSVRGRRRLHVRFRRGPDVPDTKESRAYSDSEGTEYALAAHVAAFDLDKVHARSPAGSSIGGAVSGRQSGANVSDAPVCLRRSASPRPSSISRTTMPAGVISITAGSGKTRLT